MVKHSQYFTKKQFAFRIIDLLDLPTVHHILDLGIGDAALSLAALNKWPHAYVDSIDIDNDICNNVEKLHNHIHVTNGDVLSNEGTKRLIKSSFDLALCNPPYGVISGDINLGELFSSVNMEECLRIKRLSADIVFIAKNFLYLKDRGILAVILPDGLLSRKDLYSFRVSLIEHHQICCIYQLPEKSFSLTEARTHIVILKKNGKTPSKVRVGMLDMAGNIKDEIFVDKGFLCERMDFSYLKWKLNKKLRKELALRDVSIKRGGVTYKDLRSLNFPFLHSSSFKNGEILCLPDMSYDFTVDKVLAQAGDIVMCRVGKRSVGKVAFIKEGKVPISDCVYKITVTKGIERIVFDRLLDEDTKEWICSCAHGVCSKVISKVDLLQYLMSL